MTERYQHVTYKIGFVADLEGEKPLSPEVKARILEKMNARLQADVERMFYGSKEERHRETVLRVEKTAAEVARGTIRYLTLDTP